MITQADLDRRFDYHAPDDAARAKHEEIRAAAKSFAAVVIDSTPTSREQSTAITNIEDALMWANKAIACNPPS